MPWRVASSSDTSPWDTPIPAGSYVLDTIGTFPTLSEAMQGVVNKMTEMRLGSIVQRNPERWPYGGQDEDLFGNRVVGEIVATGRGEERLKYEDVVSVKWRNGTSNIYRVYNLKLAKLYICKKADSCFKARDKGCVISSMEPCAVEKKDTSCYREYETK